MSSRARPRIPGRWVAGVDGCRVGWIAVFVDLDGRAPAHLCLASSFVDLIDGPRTPKIIAVDMPIGLPDFIEGPGRVAEQAARPHVPGKSSSIFSVPSRKAIYAEEHGGLEDAKRTARETSCPPKAFSLEARNIFRKIREIDRLLIARPTLRSRVYETHPELAFCLLNSGVPLLSKKRNPSGRKARSRLLRKAGVDKAILSMRPPSGSQWDDLIDAVVCAVVARRIAAKEAVSYPARPGRDRYGLPVAIWA